MKLFVTICALLLMAVIFGLGSGMSEQKGWEFIVGYLLQYFAFIAGILIGTWYFRKEKK